MKIFLTENVRLVSGNQFQSIQFPYHVSSDDYQEHEGKEWGCSINSKQLK